MATMNVSLPDAMKAWVGDQVDSGQYSNASDYVRDLIRRDREYHDQRDTLIRALVAGEDSGISPRDIDAIWQRVRDRNKHGCTD